MGHAYGDDSSNRTRRTIVKNVRKRQNVNIIGLVMLISTIFYTATSFNYHRRLPHFEPEQKTFIRAEWHVSRRPYDSFFQDGRLIEDTLPHQAVFVHLQCRHHAECAANANKTIS